jgi:hypothetical protein
MTSASSCSCEDLRRSSVSQSAFWVDASDSGTRCASARWLGEGVRIRLYSDHAELPQTQSWRLQLSHPSCSKGILEDPSATVSWAEQSSQAVIFGPRLAQTLLQLEP